MTMQPAQPTEDTSVTPPVPAVVGQPTAVTAPVSPTESDADTWRARFTGLQGKYQQERERWVKDAEALAQLQAKATELETKVTNLQAEVGGSKQDLSGLTAWKQRTEIVLDEFPQLVPFLKGDLLPLQDDPARQKESLTMFANAMQHLVAPGTAPAPVPSLPTTPPAPSGSQSGPRRDPGLVKSEMIQAAKEGRNAEYDKLYTEYLALTSTQK